MPDNTHLAHLANQLLVLLFTLFYLLGSRLREARQARGWTGEEAAGWLGVDPKTYLSWERGEHKPRGLNLLTLRRAFPEPEVSIVERKVCLSTATISIGYNYRRALDEPIWRNQGTSEDILGRIGRVALTQTAL